MRTRRATDRGGTANHVAVVALGGNQGSEPALVGRFGAALRRLEGLAIGELAVSRVYRSAPLGPIADQPPFLNAACALVPRPDATPRAALYRLWEIERSLGRQRPSRPRFGPRPIDLDILWWTDRVERAPVLEIPHPRLHIRAFVLRPLADILGAAAILPDGSTLADRLVATTDQVIEATALTL